MLHPAARLASAGDLYSEAGKPEEAHKWYERALATRAWHLGQFHPHVTTLARKLASLALQPPGGNLEKNIEH